MKVDAEEVEEVDEDMGVAEAVVVSIVILPTMRAHSATAQPPLVKVPLKTGSRVSLLKGGATVDLVVLTAVVAEVVSAMEKLVMGNVLEGHLNAVVGLGEEMRSNEKGLAVETGDHKLMKLR